MVMQSFGGAKQGALWSVWKWWILCLFLNFSHPCRPLSDGDDGGETRDQITYPPTFQPLSKSRPPLTGLHVRFIRSVSLKMLNVDHLGCADSVPLSESKNGFLIRDLPDFAVERNVKSEIGFVTLVTFRKRVQYAWQPEPLKKWHVFYCLTNYAIIPCRILWSAVRITTMEHKQIKKEAC